MTLPIRLEEADSLDFIELVKKPLNHGQQILIRDGPIKTPFLLERLLAGQYDLVLKASIKDYSKYEDQEDLFYDLLLLLRQEKIDIRTFAYMHHLTYACRRFECFPDIIDITFPEDPLLKEALFKQFFPEIVGLDWPVESFESIISNLPVHQRMIAFFPLDPEYGFQNEQYYRNHLARAERMSLNADFGANLVYLEWLYDKLHNSGIDRSMLSTLKPSLYNLSGPSKFRLSAPLFVSDSVGGGYLSQPVYHSQIISRLMSLIYPQDIPCTPRYVFGKHGPYDVLDQLERSERVQQLYHPGCSSPESAHGLCTKGIFQFDMVHHDSYHLAQHMATDPISRMLSSYVARNLLKLRMSIENYSILAIIDNAQTADQLTHVADHSPAQRLRRIYNMATEWMYHRAFRNSHLFIYVCLFTSPDVKSLHAQVEPKVLEQLRGQFPKGSHLYHDELLDALLEEYDDPIQVYSAKNLIRLTLSLCHVGISKHENKDAMTLKLLFMLSNYDIKLLSPCYTMPVFYHKIFGDIETAESDELTSYVQMGYRISLKPRLKKYVEKCFSISIDDINERIDSIKEKEKSKHVL